jgi:Flp pilus assembly protein TadG
MTLSFEFMRRSRSLLPRFARDNRGNVAMLFGLLSTVIVGAAGGAVDFARAVDERARMAAALDTAALAVGASSSKMTTAQMQELAQTYFDANFQAGDGTAGPVQVVADKETVSLSVSSKLPTVLLGIAGIKDLNIGVKNEVQRASLPKKMQIALALDNTGSMAWSGKMTALKDATDSFLDMIEDAAKADPDSDIRNSIIPFAREVNVGKSNYPKGWLKWGAWDAANGEDVCVQWNKKKCVEWAWQPDNHNTWNGCVQDRDQSNDVKNTKPNAGQPATQFPAIQSPYCPTSLLALTDNWTALHNKVDAMTPVGNTNTTIGLAWAYQALTNGEPLNAPPKSPEMQQIILFLTDGDNTQNRWTTNQASIDARMKIACQNVKNAGIRLYTILVIDGNETLLKDCASEAGNYYKITKAEDLVAVFESIATELTNLHLSK